MSGIWAKIFKPRGWVAKWLIFIALLGILFFNASDMLQPVREFLSADRLSFSIGEQTFTAYSIINSILTIVVLIWISGTISEVAESQIGRLPRMRTANKELIIKFAQIFVYVAAALIGLDLIGLDLTTLTVFSGALGIGLGFGLQKTASNFISGLILLMEKSIEVNDLVELTDGTYGFIRRTGARYTLIETFDNKEILIPNEDFITNRVTNWTFSNNRARVEIPIGVSYSSNLDQVREILLAAAADNPRCIREPKPVCYLRNFGESSVDFILHFWVDDVENGRWQPQSEVMMDIWNRFAEAGVSIPFPQRDLHIRSGLPPVATTEPNPTPNQKAEDQNNE